MIRTGAVCFQEFRFSLIPKIRFMLWWKARRRETCCTDYSASLRSWSSCEYQTLQRLLRLHFLCIQESLCHWSAACTAVGASQAGRDVFPRQNNLGSLITQARKEDFTVSSLAFIIKGKTEICCSRVGTVQKDRAWPSWPQSGTALPPSCSPWASQRLQQLPPGSGPGLQRWQLFQPRCSGC